MTEKKMEFERIVENLSKQGIKPTPKGRKVEVRLMDCPECGKQMQYSYSGPRAAFGSCECGFRFIS